MALETLAVIGCADSGLALCSFWGVRSCCVMCLVYKISTPCRDFPARLSVFRVQVQGECVSIGLIFSDVHTEILVGGFWWGKKARCWYIDHVR